MSRFEKWWLEQLDFKSVVTKVWSTNCAFEDDLDIWQFKIRLLRKKKLRDGLLISMLILEEERMNSLRRLILWV
jgi:hypothetical protein